MIFRARGEKTEGAGGEDFSEQSECQLSQKEGSKKTACDAIAVLHFGFRWRRSRRRADGVLVMGRAGWTGQW